MLVFGCAVFGNLAGAAAWLILRDRPGWAGKDIATVVVGVAGVGVALVTAFAGPLFVDWLAEKRTGGAPPALTTAQLEAWHAVLRVAVLDRRVRGEGSQLDQMLRYGKAFELHAIEQVDAIEEDAGRPRLNVQGQTIAWSQMTTEWDQAGGRMVVLGDPGYGKTVAALMLLKYVNRSKASTEPIVEMFPLVEWYGWQGEHSGERLSDWLATQLSTTYPELPRDIALALINADLVVPVLDGLDDVPDSHRLACKEAIDSYAGRSPPFRSFVLTCRVQEYADLAPEWVTCDRQIRLLGLEPDQIASVLEKQTAGRAGWSLIRERVAAGDQGLIELFHSPMNLAIALQAYRDQDAGELAKLNRESAEGHLWDKLLTLDSQQFHRADQGTIRAWLQFLAAGMQRESRQRFWLHELYLLAPDRVREVRRFGIQLGVGVRLADGLAFALVAWFVAGLVPGLVIALVAMLTAVLAILLRPDIRWTRSRLAWPGARALASGVLTWLPVGLALELEVVRVAGLFAGLLGGVILTLAGGVGTALLIGAYSEAPSVMVIVPWRTRIHGVRKDITGTLVLALAGGAAWGLVGQLSLGSASGPEAALAFGLVGVLATGLAVGLVDFVRAGTANVSADPPRRLAGRGVSAVLGATRNVAVVGGLVAGFVLGLASGGIFGVGFGLGPGLAFGLAFGWAFGVGFALVAGLTPWLYHYWLRRRLARQGLIPRRLKGFLDWCASPNRGWMRVSDAYEFRHRELLDHLSNAPRATTTGVIPSPPPI